MGIKRQPTFADLAGEAMCGNEDAALQLAKRAPDRGFELWFKRWVPGDERAGCFDVFADAYRRMELDKLDTQCGDIDRKAAA